MTEGLSGHALPAGLAHMEQLQDRGTPQLMSEQASKSVFLPQVFGTGM